MTSEEEEFEFRHRAEQEQAFQAMATQGQQTQPAPEQSLPQAAQASLQQIAAPFEKAGQALQPKNLTGLLPVGGMIAGNAILPGAGGAAGAGLGSIAQKMANMVYGTSGPVNPTTSIAGIPMNPKAAIDPMINAASAGIPDTNEGQAIGQKIAQVYDSAKPVVKNGLSKFFGMTTGKGPVKVARMINDPTAVIPESLPDSLGGGKIGLGGSKSIEAASDQYGEKLAQSGLEKKLYGPFSEGKAAADADANAIFTKWANKEPITAQEAYNAKRATDKLWPAVVKESNRDDIRLMSKFKNGMDDILSNQSGDFLNASKDYARSRLGEDFTQILPRTKTGDVSTVKTMYAMLNPKKIPGMLVTSPALIGAGNLAAQGAMKGLNIVGRDPNTRQALMGILQQIMQNRQPQQPLQ